MKALFLQDASVLLNLLATDHLEVMSADTGWRFAICTAVHVEAKKLRDPSTGDMIPIDIEPLIRSGVLQVLTLSGSDEQTLFIENVASLDDGEAMSLAIASSRRLELAVDDKAAIKFAREHFPEMCLWTTPELIKYWADAVRPPADVLGSVIEKIESRSRYFPPRAHPLAQWWQSAKDGAKPNPSGSDLPRPDVAGQNPSVQPPQE
jgi:predicted nucleic acid-binding protein